MKISSWIARKRCEHIWFLWDFRGLNTVSAGASGRFNRTSSLCFSVTESQLPSCEFLDARSCSLAVTLLTLTPNQSVWARKEKTNLCSLSVRLVWELLCWQLERFGGTFFSYKLSLNWRSDLSVICQDLLPSLDNWSNVYLNSWSSVLLFHLGAFSCNLGGSFAVLTVIPRTWRGISLSPLLQLCTLIGEIFVWWSSRRPGRD